MQTLNCAFMASGESSYPAYEAPLFMYQFPQQMSQQLPQQQMYLMLPQFFNTGSDLPMCLPSVGSFSSLSSCSVSSASDHSPPSSPELSSQPEPCEILLPAESPSKLDSWVQEAWYAVQEMRAECPAEVQKQKEFLAKFSRKPTFHYLRRFALREARDTGVEFYAAYADVVQVAKDDIIAAARITGDLKAVRRALSVLHSCAETTSRLPRIY